MTQSNWYLAYLKSEHWQQMRETKLEEQDWQCERCGHFAQRDQHGNRLGVDVHHRTYERLGEETLEDLEVLCRTCHSEEHGLPAVRAEVQRARITNYINRRLGTDYELDEDEQIALGLLPDEIDREVAAWDDLSPVGDC